MSARIPDGNGWFEVPGNPLSRAGVFDYLGSSINAPDRAKMYRVYRPASELRDPATLNSFRLLPLINDHVMLGSATPDAVPAEYRGVHGVIGDQVYFDEDLQAICGNLKVFSTNLQRIINAGKVDLSCGYLCKYDFTPGVTPTGEQYDAVQTSIRGNHLALVNEGRMGDSVSVMDSVTFTFDHKDIKPMALKDTNKAGYAALKKRLIAQHISTLRANKVKFKSTFSDVTMDAAESKDADDAEPSLSDVSELLADIMPQIADINASIEPAAPDDDMEPDLGEDGKQKMGMDGKPLFKKKADPKADAAKDGKGKDDDMTGMDAAAIKKIVDEAVAAAVKPFAAAMDSKSVFATMKTRDELAKSLAPFCGAFDACDMTTEEVAKYGCAKLSIPTRDGAELDSVRAWLHGRQPARPIAATGQDAKAGCNSVAKYLNGAA